MFQGNAAAVAAVEFFGSFFFVKKRRG